MSFVKVDASFQGHTRMTKKPGDIRSDQAAEPGFRSFLGGFILAARAPLNEKWKIAAVLLGAAAGIAGAVIWLS